MTHEPYEPESARIESVRRDATSMTAPRIDAEFARYCRSGDSQSLAAVFDGTAHKLLLLAVHLTGDEVGAEDLVQSTFLKIIENAHQWNPDLPFLPWANTILANEARMAWRKRQRAARGGRITMREPTDPRSIAEQAEAIDVLTVAIDRLDDRYRQVLKLKLLHGLKGVEIARLLDLPPATVRSRTARGLELLRQAVPAGLAGMAMLLVRTRGMAQIRQNVLEHASAVRTASAAAGGGLGARLLIAALSLSTLIVVTAIVADFDWTAGRVVESLSGGGRAEEGGLLRDESSSADGAGLPLIRTAMHAPDSLADRREAGSWTLSGTVRDQDGAVVSDALVSVQVLHGCDVTQLPPVRCDERGAYRIDVAELQRLGDLGLPGASLLIYPSASGCWPHDGELREDLPRHCTDRWSPQQDLVLHRGALVTGRISRPDGSPTTGAYSVRLRRVDGGAPEVGAWCHVDAGGPFVLGLPDPGPFLVEVEGDDGVLRHPTGRLDPSRDHDLGELRLIRFGVLAGRFIAADGLPIPYINFTATRIEGSLGLDRPRWLEGDWQLADRVFGRSDGRGEFRHVGMAAGRYRLVVCDALGGAQEFEVTADVGAGDLRLTGQVCEVHMLDSQERRIPGLPLGWIGELGDSSLSGVHEISYRGGVFHMLLPMESRWEFACRHWSIRGPVTRHAARHGMPRARIEVHSEAAPAAGRLRLRVRDSGGAAVADYRVELRDSSTGLFGPRVDAADLAALRLPVGRYRVEVDPSDPWLVSCGIDVEVRAGVPVTVAEAVVQRGGQLEVTVRGESIQAHSTSPQVQRFVADRWEWMGALSAGSGESSWRLPRALEAGDYRLRVVAAGFVSDDVFVVVRAGEVARFAAYLRRR